MATGSAVMGGVLGSALLGSRLRVGFVLMAKQIRARSPHRRHVAETINAGPADRGRIDWDRRFRGGNRARPGARAEHAIRHHDRERQHARRIVGAGESDHGQQIEQCTGAEENEQQPDRQVAVVCAFERDGEFRIGEGEIDDGAQPFALDLLSDEVERPPRRRAERSRRSRTSGARCGREIHCRDTPNRSIPQRINPAATR